MTRKPHKLEHGNWDVFPDLSFWYGLSIEELARTPKPLLRLYLRELPRLRAQVMRDDITVSAFPYMTDKSRDRLLDRLERISGEGVEEKAAKPQTKEEIAAALMAAGIGFVHVPKESE